MHFAVPFDAAQNSYNPAAQRGNEYAARPQRMLSDGLSHLAVIKACILASEM